MNRPVPIIQVKRLRRHSTSSSAPYPPALLHSTAAALRTNVLVKKVNKAIQARIKHETEGLLRKHNKMLKRKRRLMEANIRLRHKYV